VIIYHSRCDRHAAYFLLNKATAIFLSCHIVIVMNNIRACVRACACVCARARARVRVLHFVSIKCSLLTMLWEGTDVLIFELGMKGGWWTALGPSSFTSQKRAPKYPHSWRLGGPQTQYGCFVEETIYLPCQRFNFSVLQPLSQWLCQLCYSGSLWEDKFWIHKTVSLSENTVVDQRESVWYACWCIRKNCSYSKFIH